MRNKNIKKKKNNNIKFKMSDKALQKQKIRKEKNIWFWLIFFPPIGIYKCFRHKAFSNWINISMIVVLLMATILCIDTMFNPNRVFDMKVKKMVNTNEEIGEFRQGELIGSLNEKYIIYNVITTTGVYDLYFTSDFNVNLIKEVSHDRKTIYEKDFEIIDNELYSELIRFFNEDENVIKYGELKKVISSDCVGQTVETTMGIYQFDLKYNQVIKISKLQSDDDFEKVYSKTPNITIPNDILKIILKRKNTLGELDKPVKLEVDQDNISYIVKMKNNNYYKVAKSNDGIITIYNADSNGNNLELNEDEENSTLDHTH